MSPALTALVLRRALPVSARAVALALAALAVWADWDPRPEWGASVVPGALARQATWTLLSLAIGPVLVHAAAGVIARWRAGEIEWLASSGIGRDRALVSVLCGLTLASLAAVSAIAVSAECSAGSSAPGRRAVERLRPPATALHDGATTLRWVATPPRQCQGSGASLRVGVRRIAGAPAAEVELSVARSGSGEAARVRAQVAEHAWLEVAMPPGEGPLELALALSTPGAIAVADGTTSAWLAPAWSSRAASADLALRAFCALLAACALALGFSAWVNPSIATAAAITAAIPAWLGNGLVLESAWWPWAELPHAISLAGEGLAPSPPPFETVAGALIAVAVGFALAVSQRTVWRRVP